MRWKRVDNPDIDDRRGQGGGGGLGGGGMSGLPFPIPTGKAGGGGVGLIVLIVVLALVFGRGLIGGDGSSGITPIDLPDATSPTGDSVPSGDTSLELVKVVSKDIQDFWTAQFAAAGKEYPRAGIVVFSSGTRSGCGVASAATGPFYCPLDQRVYLDLGFFDELAGRFGAPGDFAQAYVVAHELGHHVQKVLGIEGEVRQQQQDEPGLANELSVRMELQADCLAGVWGHSVWEGTQSGQGNLILEAGDVEEGVRAAQAVGDDRLGASSPETWTHGSSALRSKWFQAGFSSGDSGDCDTFSGDL